MTGDFATALAVGDREVVAFVGAGGKSTSLLLLGAELVASGRRVVMTTTTKMGVDQAPPWAAMVQPGDDLDAGLDAAGAVFVAAAVEGEKVTGVAPQWVDALFAARTASHVLVEADGARRRSFKAPASHEPVIPASTSVFVVVAGLDAVGGRIVDVAHRPERVAELLGRSVEHRLRAADVVGVVADPAGGLKGAPSGARIVVVLTKAGAAAPGVAEEVRDRLATVVRIERVLTFDGLPDGGGR